MSRAASPADVDAPALGSQVQSGDSTVWVMDDEHVREPFVISAGGKYIGVFNHSVTIGDSGESAELSQAKALRAKVGGDFIWFVHEGKSYIIRDRATIDRALEIYKPIQELGAQQDELGKQQDELGKQQDELGEQMETVKVKIPDLSAEMRAIKAKMRELSANGGTQDEVGELQSQLGEIQSRLGEIESAVGREQSKIGRQQGELGRKQGELGRKQGAIGRQQGELSKKAVTQMETLLERSQHKRLGAAKPAISRIRAPQRGVLVFATTHLLRRPFGSKAHKHHHAERMIAVNRIQRLRLGVSCELRSQRS